MFTGIVQHIGTIRSLTPTAAGARMIVGVGDWPHRARPGDSICVSGCCLTHAPGDDLAAPGELAFDLVHETLRKTKLGSLTLASRVNLEPALAVGDRLDGHFVLGHVDRLARVASVDAAAGEHLLSIQADPEMVPYLIPTGSITVDGVSLTLARTDPPAARFTVALIPTTLHHSTLGELRPGDDVNLEADVLVKTVVHTLAHRHA